MNDKEELERLRDAVRKHRDQRGDDRCWMDDEELYKVLPEGYVPPERDTSVELEHCKQYIACRRNPATTYISPERRIEELEKAFIPASNHDSNRMSRAANIIEEGIYLKLWQERQVRNCHYGLLDLILNNRPLNEDPPGMSSYSQRDAYVAASVIQWLGTCQGLIFINEAEERIKAAKKKAQKEWHQKYNIDMEIARKQQEDILESL
jgi:hypothetical protein